VRELEVGELVVGELGVAETWRWGNWGIFVFKSAVKNKKLPKVAPL